MTYNKKDFQEILNAAMLADNAAKGATNDALWYMLANTADIDRMQEQATETSENYRSHKTKVMAVHKALTKGKIHGLDLTAALTDYEKNGTINLFSISSEYQRLDKAPKTPKTSEYVKLQKAIKDKDVNTGDVKSANQLIDLKKLVPSMQATIDGIIKEYDNRQFALIFPSLDTDNIEQVAAQVVKYIKEIEITNGEVYDNIIRDIATPTVKSSEKRTEQEHPTVMETAMAKAKAA